MELVKSVLVNLEENVRLLKNFIKAIDKQQKALINNYLLEIQESALEQASLIEKIAMNQHQLSIILKKVNENFKINLPDDKFLVLKSKISPGLYKKIDNLLDLQKVYQLEIEESKKNNTILLENAMDFVQNQMKIIVDSVKETPFYKNKHKQNHVKSKNAFHILNKKL